MIVVVMGVSGSGKTTVGRTLAAALATGFVDADDLHTAADMAQMVAGTPLTDAQREPWIGRVHDALVAADDAGRDLVVACSALRADHRDALHAGISDLRWVHLLASPETIGRRLRDRAGGVGPSLLPSQLAALEPPADALEVTNDGPVADVVATIMRLLRA